MVRPKIPTHRLFSFKLKPHRDFDVEYPSPFDPSAYIARSKPLVAGESLDGFSGRRFFPSSRDIPTGFNKETVITVFLNAVYGPYVREPAPGLKLPFAYADYSVRGDWVIVNTGGPGDCTIGFYFTDGWLQVFCFGYIGQESYLYGEAAASLAVVEFFEKLRLVAELDVFTDCYKVFAWINGTRSTGRQKDVSEIVKDLKREFPLLKNVFGWEFKHEDKEYNKIADALVKYAHSICVGAGIEGTLQLSNWPPSNKVVEAVKAKVQWTFTILGIK